MPTYELRTVVVTGASAGIGRAVALAFARRHWRVGVIARSETALSSVVREIDAQGGQALSFACDVADSAAVLAAAQAVVARWGAIDVWVNDAMVSVLAPLAETTPEEFRRVTEVTYLGCVHGTMAALAAMRPRNSGTIVQVGSALSYRAIPLQAAYCGAKFAIRGFTDALRCELRHDRSAIRLTMVQLPAVNTPQFDWIRDKLGRAARPVAPVFQPEAVAERLYRLAQRPSRELWLGWSSAKAILGGALAPGLVDRYLARRGYSGQCTADPQLPNEGNLFAPGASHRTRGRFDDEARDRVVALNPAWLRVTLAALAVAGAAFLLVPLGFGWP